MPQKIVIASDHAGFSLKKSLVAYLKRQGYNVLDLGPSTGENALDYPLKAEEVANEIKKNSTTKGIAICGTGIGMPIAVNRYPFIRGALAYKQNAVRLARQHNNANVLCLGGRITSPKTAKTLVDTFLNTKFEGGRHERRVKELGELK